MNSRWPDSTSAFPDGGAIYPERGEFIKDPYETVSDDVIIGRRPYLKASAASKPIPSPN